MHQTVCTSLVLNILAFTLLFTIFKYSVTRCYMKGLLCNIVRVPVNSGAISLAIHSVTWYSHGARWKRETEENDTRPLAFCLSRCIIEKRKKRPMHLRSPIAFLSYEGSDARMSFFRVIIKSKVFYKIRVGHLRVPSKIIFFIRSVRLSLPNRFPHCTCPWWRRSVRKSLKKLKGS